MTDSKVLQIKSTADLKGVLAGEYQRQIENFFAGDKGQALRFLSSAVTATQMNPKLLECEPVSLINSFIKMAQLQLMPSDVSGEAYVLPYGKVAQFQLGYQGYLTLFYRAGVQAVRSEIVRKNDEFNYENGQIYHKVDILKKKEQRGTAIGCYAIATVNGVEIVSVMNGEDIMAHGQKFSKSFSTDYSPWKESNDPELWMWKKTVIKQLAKLLPKNETINKAIAFDNVDSTIKQPNNVKGRLNEARKSTNLTMSNFQKDENKNSKTKSPNKTSESDQGEE